MREALKMALEALLWANKEINGWLDDRGLEPEDHPEIMLAVTAIKEALAQPEQEKERCVGCEACIDTACGRDECPKGWPKAVQPEQEPVEWGVDWGKDGNSVSIIKRLADGNIEVLAWEYSPHPPQPKEPEQEPVPAAMKTVIEAMQQDPDYAWGWHCNIAMSFVDAGGDHYTGNQGAARFMRTLANVEPAHELPFSPPQRTWVGLTDEDYQILRDGVVKQGKPLHWMIEHIEAKLKEKNT